MAAVAKITQWCSIISFYRAQINLKISGNDKKFEGKFIIIWKKTFRVFCAWEINTFMKLSFLRREFSLEHRE